MLCNSPFLSAQKIQQVIGLVTDQNKEPIIGANVQVEGSKIGTISDLNGRFVIKADPNASLKISYIGYHTQIVKIKGQTNLTVRLIEDTQKLDEVVVIGYGTVKKSDLTGSVAVVKMDDVKDIPVARVDQMLQGRIAGAEIMSTSGEPGAGTSIRIRGTRSINATNEPLFVVDGVLMDEGFNLNEMNPSDIASIEVLKDASSTAIYGSRGANGVVLISSKQGKAGRTNFTLRADFGFSELPRYLNVMNASEFAQLENDRFFFANNDRPNVPLEEYPYPDPYALGEGTNWTKEITRVAPYQNYTFSASGGDESLKFYFSGNYNNNQGIIVNSGMERIQGRLNVDKTFSKYSKAGVRLNYSYIDHEINKADVGTNTAWWRSALFLSPLDPAYNEDGSFNDWNTLWYGGKVFDSPVAMSRLKKQDQLKKSLSSNIFWEVTPLEGLTLKTAFSFYDYNRYDDTFEPSTLPTRALNGTGAYARRRVYANNNILSENTIFYKKQFNKIHNFDALYGFTYQNSWSSDVWVSGSGYFVDAIDVNDLGAIPSKENLSVGSSRSRQVLLSHLGRLNYNYNSKYYITLTGRADGASNFAKNHKWAFFPSAAVKWNIKKEAFLQQVDPISELSLRLSAGVSGNQGIGNYRSLSEYISNSNGYIFDGSIPVSYYPGRFQNEGLTWEKTKSFNAGIDISLLQNRISLSVDYYKAITTDLLLSVQTPELTGYESRWTNIGKTTNDGIEFSINTNNITTRNFTWSTTLTFAHNNQMVNDIGGEDQVVVYKNAWGSNYTMYAYEKGYPLNALWGMKYGGTWKNQAEIDAERAKNPGDRKWVSVSESYYEPGRQRYEDINKDGQINFDDIVYLGNADPKLYGGFQNKFKIYGVDFSFFFNYSLGGKIYNPIEVFMGTGSNIANQFQYMVNAWHPTRNPNSDIPRVNSQDNVPCDRFVHDASFLRLKNVSIGYTFNLAKATKDWIRSINVSLNGNNLYLWKYYNGYDPEVSSQSGGSTIRRMDNGAYPASRTYTLSAQINF
ncbi:MAG: TonB-dependent receptor [Bacteroidales bacterium]